MLARSEALANAEYRSNPEHRAAVLDMLAGYYHSNGDDLAPSLLIREGLDSISVSRDVELRRKLTCDHAVLMEYAGKGARRGGNSQCRARRARHSAGNGRRMPGVSVHMWRNAAAILSAR